MVIFGCCFTLQKYAHPLALVCLKFLASLECQEQKLFMADVVRPRAAVFIDTRVTFNIAYMPIYTKSQPFSPSSKDHLAFHCYLSSLLLGLLGYLYFGIRVHHLRTLMHAFASLSLISLLHLLLPDTWESFGFSVYTFWFIIHVFIIFRSRFRDTWVQHQGRVPHPLLPITSMDFN
ncbi:hypothetical protein V8G54_010472 [Vigna mungo]|uniref:Uncharacterized protein n=1 Tax=Vigna mungo TaxID=3915 RepID=A0AAQ3NWL9_VIGMU